MARRVVCALLLIFLGAVLGCSAGSSLTGPSADETAIREWFREQNGDGFAVDISEVSSAMKPSQFEIQESLDGKWSPAVKPGRYVTAKIKAANPLFGGDSEMKLLFVINGKKVDDFHMWFKKK